MIFNLDEFANEVMEQPEVIESFNRYKSAYQQERDIDIADDLPFIRKKIRKDMSYNPEIHHRRSIRLKGYDYSQAGLYFITICTQNREYLFGEIAGAI